MHPIAALHKHLQKAVPSIHRTRLQALMAAVGSVLCGAQVSITSLGRSLSNAAFVKHKIKRMDRLIGNTRLYQDRWGLYAALTQWLVRAPQRIGSDTKNRVRHDYHLQIHGRTRILKLRCKSRGKTLSLT